jgi:hypothetical protein
MISRLLRIDTQLAHDAVEIIIAIVFDGNASTLFGMVNDHACGQAPREKILQVLDCGRERGFARDGASSGRFSKPDKLLSGQLFRHPNGCALPHNDIHQQSLLLVRLEGKQDFSMPDGDSPLFEERLRTRVQVEKPHGVRDRRSAFADAFGDLILGESEIAMEAFVGAGLLDGIEIFALKIFDESELQHLAIACRANDCWSFGEFEFARGTPAAFTSDEFVLVAYPSNDERLDDATLPNALYEFLEMLTAKLLPWLQRARCNLIQRQGLDALAKVFPGGRSGHASVYQGAESFAKCGFCHGRFQIAGRCQS